MKRLAPLVLPDLPDVVEPRGRRPWLALAVGLGMEALFTLIRVRFPGSLGAADRPYLLYVSAVLAAAWLGGQLPALAVTLTSAAVATYFFVAPGALVAASGTELTRLLIFLVAGLFLSLVCEALHRARERMEERTNELQHEMRERRVIEVELRTVNERKDQFLAILAHELRNPLTPIVSAASLLHARNVDDPMVRRAATLIDRHATHMVHLIDDLLDVARIERGTFELRKGPVVVHEVVECAIEHCRSAMMDRRHHLDLSVPESCVVIEADHVRLVQLISNLLSNAIAYTPPGGEIHLQAALVGTHLRVVVRDSGVGIAPDVISRIFGLFERGAAVPSGATGLGIGLALVHQIARLHGGRVSARSDGVGQGSEFTAVIPAVPVSVPVSATVSAPLSIPVSVAVPERTSTHALHPRHTRTATA